MDFTFTPEQEQFRREIREFCAREVTQDLLERAIPTGPGGLYSEEFHLKMAERGWLGLAWPKEYGGQARSHIDMAIFAEEMAYARAPMGAYGSSITFVGNSLVAYGSEEQKRYFLPRIARGELRFAWALTEPNAGSDAASLQTSAQDVGDHFLINGQKIFISAAHISQWALMACRTDPSLPKHRGISIFLVDLSSPGVTIRPLITLPGGRVNEVFLEDVKVPRENLVGEKNQGWYHVTTTLDFERSGAAGVGEIRRTFDDLLDYVRERRERGAPIPGWPVLRHKLAELAIDIEIVWCMSYRIAWKQSKGIPLSVDASMGKLLRTELGQRLAQVGMQILGEYALLEGEEAKRWLCLGDLISQRYKATLVDTIAGGSSEIQRNIIAIRGLGLPR